MNQYMPIYHVVLSEGAGDLSVGGESVDLLPDPGTVYYLSNTWSLIQRILSSFLTGLLTQGAGGEVAPLACASR